MKCMEQQVPCTCTADCQLMNKFTVCMEVKVFMTSLQKCITGPYPEKADCSPASPTSVLYIFHL